MSNNNVVSIAQAKRAILDCIAHSPALFRPLILGAPGTAKTALIRQIAQSIGYECRILILSQMMPEQVAGYPYIVDGIMKFSRPEFWPTEKKVMLFVDEIGQCPMALQNVAMQLIHERKIGPHQLPDDTIVIGAGNRAEDRAGSTVMQTALRTRFFPVFTVEPTKDEWIDHARDMNFNPFITAYVTAIRENVLEFDPREKGGFVSPRTLEQAGHLMSAFREDPDNPDLVAGLYGILGDRSASEFLAYVKTFAAMPSYDDIRKTPSTAPVVPDMVDPVSSMLARNVRFGHLSSVVRYIKRYDAELQVRLLGSLHTNMESHPDVKQLRQDLGLLT
jgi:MoxR-like ATPase